MTNMGRSQRRCTRSGVPTHTGSSLAGPGSVVPCSASLSATCCTDVRLGAHCSSTPNSLSSARWPPHGNVTTGLSCSGSPTITARLARHSAPTAYCGGACPASSTNSQPSDSRPRPTNSLSREANVVDATGTTRKKVCQAAERRRVGLGCPFAVKDVHQGAEIPAECVRLGQDQRLVQGKRREEQFGPRLGELCVGPRCRLLPALDPLWFRRLRVLRSVWHMVAPAQAGSMDLAPQFLEFVRQAIACAASVSLFVAGRDQAACHVLGGTRCGVPFPIGCHESAVQLGVFCLPGPAYGTSVPGQRKRTAPACQAGTRQPPSWPSASDHPPRAVGDRRPADRSPDPSQSYRGFKVGVRLRTVLRCDREPGDGM